MTHRERILSALAHSAPDRVPVDLGSTFSTSINAQAYTSLRAWLGLTLEPTPAFLLSRAATVIPGEDIVSRFSLDARPLVIGAPERDTGGYLSDNTYMDEWGVTWTKPAGGHFINSDGPFCRLDSPTLKDLEAFAWPDPDDPGRYRGLRERAKLLHETTDQAVVLNLWVGLVHLAQFVRGFAQWLEDLLANPVFAEGLMERIMDFWTRGAERALSEAGEFIDVVAIVEDLGTQQGPLLRPEVYRRMIKPHHRIMMGAVKRHGKRLFLHSCGSVTAFIPDFIEMGVDALNPVQVSAAHMDTKKLKREYGRDLSFWGAVDTGRVLPHGTPADVRDEVKRRIDDLAADGGYVLAAVHNIQADVPPQNVAAMYDAALEYGAAA
jgi:uroporphyrinogen decarboxylase